MIFDSSTGICHEDRGILDEVVALRIPFRVVLNNKTRLPQMTSGHEIETLCRKHPGFAGLHEGDVRNHDFALGVLTSLQNP